LTVRTAPGTHGSMIALPHLQEIAKVIAEAIG
jgi:hypothetical protein